jgi:hypothetical protein
MERLVSFAEAAREAEALRERAARLAGEHAARVGDLKVRVLYHFLNSAPNTDELSPRRMFYLREIRLGIILRFSIHLNIALIVRPKLCRQSLFLD